MMSYNFRRFRTKHAVWHVLLVFQIACASLFAAPIITATKNDNVPAATKKPAGSTVTYTTTITNSGDVTGTGMNFTDPNVANTTLTGSVKVTPVAQDDAFATVGNTQLVVNAAAGLLSNDHDPDSATFSVKAGSVTRVSATGTANGTPATFAVNADGSFTYSPGIGATGSERWQYVITDGDAQDCVVPGYVDFSITGRVWYVQAGAVGGKTGRSHEPFDTPAAASTAANASTDFIYVFSSGSALNGAFTLEDGQKLLGQGVDLTVGALTPFTAGVAPALTHTGGNTVTLGGSNTISGLVFGNRSGAAISGSSFGTLTVTSDVIINGTGQALNLTTGTLAATFASISASSAVNGISLATIGGTLTVNAGLLDTLSGDDLVINGGTLAVTYSGRITNTAGRSVNISNKTSSGDVTINGRISDSGTGTGILLDNNDGATITLKSLGLNTGANTAFSAINGGTVVVTNGTSDGVNNDGDGQTDEADEANTITTTSGTALNVANTNIGAAGLTFLSISVNGGSNGIVLNNTGANGGLTVTGTGTTDGSGGTIQSTSTRGASFITARNITLKNMNFTNAATADNPGAPTGLSLGVNTADNAAIHLDNVFNATLDNLNINGSAEQGINGHNVTNFTLKDSVLTALGGGPDEDGIHFFNMLGTCAITNTSISGSGDDNINIQNNTNLAIPAGMSATGTLAITGGNANTGVLGSGYLFGIRGTSNTTITISGVTSDNNFSGGIVADSFDTATMALEVSGSTITNNNDGIQVSANNGTATFNIHNNVAFSGQDFLCISLLKAAFSTGGTLSGSINSNPFTVANGRPTDAISVFNAGGGALNAAITNNTINYGGTQRAILVQAGQDGAGSIRTQVTGNTIDMQLDGSLDAVAGMLVQASITSPTGDGASVDAKIGGAGSLRNTFTHSLGGTMAGGDIRVRQRLNGTFNLDGYGGGATDTTAVATYLNGRNTVVSASTASAQSTGFSGVATPAVPLLFASGEPEEFNLGTPDSVASAIAWTEAVRQIPEATPSTPATKALEVSQVKPETSAAGLLDQSQLDSLVSAARTQWRKSGLNAAQSAALDTVTFEVADLPGWYLGEASGQSIRIDNNAGGNGWFIDTTPMDDAEFSNSLEKSDATARVDLLTTLMHEMGHSLGLCDSYSKDLRGSVMYGFLTKGERRLPKAGEAAGAVPHAHTTPHFLGAPIGITGGLPPGKSVVITYTVTIDDPLPLGTQSLISQGTVSGSNFADVLTDDAPSNVADPVLPGIADPTVTLLDRPDTTVASIARATGSPTNTSSVSWTVTFANAISGLTGSNFLLLSSGLGGTPAISSVTPTGAAPATVWTVTASTGSGNGTLGLNMANDTALSHDVTNQPFTGQVYAIDTVRPTATIVVADTSLIAGETSLVTITFSEVVTGFTNADLSIANGSLTNVSSSDGGITWTATFTPTASITDATNIIALNNTGVSDTAGNTGTGSTNSNNYAIDTARPTASIVVADNNLTIGETSLVTITFSEAVTGFTNTDLTVGNGTLSPVSSGDGGVTWTATLTPTPNVTVANNVITLDNTGVQDAAGNTGTGTTDSNNYAVTSLSISIAANAPSIAEGTGAGTTAFTFTVSRAGSTAGAVTMNFAVSGAAVDAADFGGTLPSGQFTIPDTQTSAVLTILVSKDAVREPNEAFTVTLSNASGGYAITTATASSTINNDDFEADLAITVTDGVTTAVPGGSVTYTITASNAGPDPAPAATLSDTFPAALTATWTAVGAGGGTAPASGSGNINAAVSLPVGGSVTFTVSATISPAATGTLSNTATISSSVTDPVPGNNSATDSDSLTPQADLAITKTDGVTTATPGGSVTYTIVASNAGPSNSGAIVSDTFPAIVSGATWTAVGAGGGSAKTPSGSGNIFGESVILPVGGSVTYTVTAPILSSATGTLTNTATITAPAGVTDPTPGNNSASDTDTLTPQADLAITKTDGVATAVPGSSVTYTITASNSGLSNVTGATVSDTFPASLTATWTAVGAGGGTTPAPSGSGNINAPVTLPPGGSVTFTVSATISASATGNLSNTAAVTAPAGVTDPNPANNSATDTDTLTPQADLTITKTDGVTTATPGGSVTYTITAANAGPSSVTGATVADTLPASIIGATWTAIGAGGGTTPTSSGSGNINAPVTLPPGGSVTFTVSASIAASASGSLSNTATVSAPAGVTDPTPANNSATDTDTLNAQADLAITKTDGVTTATPGGSVTYTITASNAGPSNVTGATVADAFPGIISGATWTAVGAGGGTATAAGSGNINDTVNLPAGGSVTYTVTAPISAAATGTLANTATVSSAVTDPNPANNSATDTDTLTPQADLAVTVTDSPDPVIAGNNLTYMITVANNGPSAATSVVLNAPLPPGTTFVSLTSPGGWSSIAVPVGQAGLVTSTIASFAPGSVNFTLVVKVGSDLAAGTVLNDTAAISSATTDPSPGNNLATTTTTVTAQADFAVTITDSPDPVNAGGNLTYTISLTNNGPSNAVSPSVSLPLPAGTTFVSASAPIFWSATTPAVGGTGTVSFTNLSLPSGGTASFTVVAKVDLTVVNNSTLTATATAASATTDPNPGNNSATATTLAKSGADLQITLADSPDPVVAGTNLTYTLGVANNGPLDADNVSITNTLPAGTTFVSLATPAGWTATTPAVGGTGSVTIARPLFAVSGSDTFTLVVKVGPGVANGTVISDTASVTSTTIDIVPGNNSATATSTVTTQSDLAIQISGTPATAPKGSNVSYAITLTNNGPSNANAPNVSLPVPAQMTFVSATAPAGWSPTTPAVGANGTVRFSAASLASGATVNFTVVAKVNANAPTGAILTAIVTASAAGVELVPANNVAATIAAVGTVKPTAVQPITTGFAVNPQTGLFDVNVKVTNTTPLAINGFRLRVNFDAYKAAYPSLRLENATSTSKKTNVYIDYPNAMAVNATVTVKLSFYTSTRTFPSPFTPVLTVDLLATSQAAPLIGGGVQASLAKLPDKTVRLAFPTVAGRWYRVRYSSDLEQWTDCQVPIQATSNSTFWIDNGPPYTVETPANTPARFYFVQEIAAP